MRLPFSTEQFLDVFARYNQAVWPAPVLFYLAAAAVVVLASRPSRRSGRAVAGVLAFLWAWMGVVYHWGFFAGINPAAYLFGMAFLLQSALLLHAGVLRPRLSLRIRADAAGIAGAICVAYALVGYPLLGDAFGQEYPRLPTFGLPCPTTIFTFGVLLWAERGVPARLLPVPAAWSLLGASAALSHGIVQDYGLLVAGVAGTGLVLWENRARVTPGEPTPPPARGAPQPASRSSSRRRMRRAAGAPGPRPPQPRGDAADQEIPTDARRLSRLPRPAAVPIHDGCRRRPGRAGPPAAVINRSRPPPPCRHGAGNGTRWSARPAPPGSPPGRRP